MPKKKKVSETVNPAPPVYREIPKPSMTVSDKYIPKNLKEPKLGQKVQFVVTAEVRRAEQYRDWNDGSPRKDVSLDIHSIKPLNKKPKTPKGGKK